MENQKFDCDLYNAVQTGEIDENSPITVDTLNGPIGGYGFRSGQWPITINGIKFSMFSSVSHYMELGEQRRTLIETAKNRVRRAIEAETFVHNGETRLRYASLMTRV